MAQYGSSRSVIGKRREQGIRVWEEADVPAVGWVAPVLRRGELQVHGRDLVYARLQPLQVLIQPQPQAAAHRLVLLLLAAQVNKAASNC